MSDADAFARAAGQRDIVDRLAPVAWAYPAGEHIVTDAIAEITQLRLQLWEARKGSVLLRLEQEEAHADRLADALRGVIDYGAVGHGDGYTALADHQRRRTTL